MFAKSTQKEAFRRSFKVIKMAFLFDGTCPRKEELLDETRVHPR
jgi:hypothetical protein